MVWFGGGGAPDVNVSEDALSCLSRMLWSLPLLPGVPWGDMGAGPPPPSGGTPDPPWTGPPAAAAAAAASNTAESTRATSGSCAGVLPAEASGGAKAGGGGSAGGGASSAGGSGGTGSYA